MSGYYSLLGQLAGMGADEGFFGRLYCSGSHLKSIEAVVGGEADAAAIDSNVLSVRPGEVQGLSQRLRVIESWGPFPIQPVVVRSSLPARLKEGLRISLLEMDARPLSSFGLRRFVPVTEEDYRSLWDEPGAEGEEGCSAILVATVSGPKRSGGA